MAKFTEKQISMLFLQSIEEAKETAKKNDELQKKINQDLEQFSNSFFEKLNKTDLKIDDNQARETIKFFERTHENARKAVNLTRFAYGLILFSVLLIGIAFYLFWLNAQTRTDILNEYQQELIKNGQYNSKEDAEYLEKYWYWRNKNPKDSKALENTIQKEWDTKNASINIFGL